MGATVGTVRVSRDQLKAAVNKVGNSVSAVEKDLKAA